MAEGAHIPLQSTITISSCNDFTTYKYVIEHLSRFLSDVISAVNWYQLSLFNLVCLVCIPSALDHSLQKIYLHSIYITVFGVTGG